MKKLIPAVAFAFGIAMAAQAQDTKTTTKTKVDAPDTKTVTYTGCVGAGTEAQSYILNKIVPVGRTTSETVGTSGTTTITTTTTWALVPEEHVEFRPVLGHKVEVTGMLVKAGDTKTQTTTKVERNNAPDTKTVEKSKTSSDYPQFHVVSVKNLSETCR